MVASSAMWALSPDSGFLAVSPLAALKSPRLKSFEKTSIVVLQLSKKLLRRLMVKNPLHHWSGIDKVSDLPPLGRICGC